MKQYKFEIIWGIAFTCVALVWMFFEKAMGWHGENIAQHATMTNIFAVIAITFYVIALQQKKKTTYKGVMTWKQGFYSGVAISVVVALLSPLSQWITHTIISPEYFPNVITYAVSLGKLTQAEAEAYFSMQSYVLQSAAGALVMGTITSAVVAFFIRTKRA